MHAGSDELLARLITMGCAHDFNHFLVSPQKRQFTSHISVWKATRVDEKFDDWNLGFSMLYAPRVILTEIVRHRLGKKLKIRFSYNIHFLVHTKILWKGMVSKNELKLFGFCEKVDTG